MSRYKIGMYTFFSNDYTFLEQVGARQAARDYNCDLFAFYIGSPMESGYPTYPLEWFESYAPIHDRNMDGLMYCYATPQLIHQAKQYAKKDYPVVLLARQAEGVTSVVPDNAGGMHQAVAHLVEHGHRRIVFVKGILNNLSAEERFKGYCEAIKKHGIPYEEDLVIHGEFNPAVAEKAMTQFLKKNIPFTGLIGANDLSTLGAVKAMQANGLRVPDDIAVIGFDNSPRARGLQPPLTSLLMPSFEMGYRGFEILLSQIRGEKPEKRTYYIPTRMIRRVSCGCQSEVVALAGSLEKKDAEKVQEELLQVLSSHAHRSLSHQLHGLAKRLFESASKNNEFLEELMSVLREAHKFGFAPENSQNLISILRAGLLFKLPWGPEREHAERIYQQARVMISEIAIQHHIQQHNLKRNFDYILRTLGRTVTARSDEETLLQTFKEFLSEIIHYFGIIFYENQGKKGPLEGSLALWHSPKKTLMAANRKRFPLQEFNLKNIMPEDETSHAMAIYSLNAEQDEMGLLLLDMDNDYFFQYDNLVGQMSLALKSIRLFTALQNSTAEVRQRTIDLEKEIIERKRAEENVTAQEARIRTILNSTADGIITVDEHGLVKSFNLTAEKIYGYRAEEVVSKKAGMLALSIPEESTSSRNGSSAGKSESALAASEREVEGRRKDGSSFPLVLRVSETKYADERLLIFSVQDITERKNAQERLQTLNNQILTARQVGMAEVATGVLHNVGNVLNSVNVSASIVSEKLSKSKLVGLDKAAELLRQNTTQLAEFLTQNPQGRQLPDYLQMLAKYRANEQATMLKELDTLIKHIHYIKDIVSMQQSLSGVSGEAELVSLSEVIEDALKISATGFERSNITVQRNYAILAPTFLDKAKLMQILVNLVRNAKDALDHSNTPSKQIQLQTESNGNGFVRIHVVDNGIGILPENLKRIFTYGFTTKKGGHGFGLHTSAIAAKEMGGELIAQSNGPGTGARFTVLLPFKPSKN